MRKSGGRPNPVFVQAIERGLFYWLAETKELEADSIKLLDVKKDNLYQILGYAEKLPELWQLMADVMVQAFPMPYRNGYGRDWLARVQKMIASAPMSISATTVQLLVDQGKIERVLGGLHEALRTHQIALQEAKKIGDEMLLAVVWMELGWSYLNLNDLEKAYLFAESAYQFYQTALANPTIHMVDAMRVMGKVETRKEQTKRAIHMLTNALSYAHAVGKSIVIARTYLDLGDAFRVDGDILSATQHYGKARDVLVNTTYELDKESITMSMGLLYYSQEMWDAAETFFKLVNIQTFRNAGQLSSEAALLNNFGFVYMKQGRYVEAETVLQVALTLWKQAGDEMNWANTQSTLAEVHVMQDRFERAGPLIAEGLAVIEKYIDQPRAKRIETDFKNLLEKMSDAKKTGLVVSHTTNPAC